MTERRNSKIARDIAKRYINMLEFLQKNPRVRAADIKRALGITESQWKPISSQIPTDVRILTRKGKSKSGYPFRTYELVSSQTIMFDLELQEDKIAECALGWGFCSSLERINR